MNVVMQFITKYYILIITVTVYLGIGQNAFAVTNDCNARVTFERSQRSPNNAAYWVFFFKVATECDNSTGRFKYSYFPTPGAKMTTSRTTVSWTAANGKTFDWTDEVGVAPDQRLQFGKVLQETIESTRIK